MKINRIVVRLFLLSVLTVMPLTLFSQVTKGSISGSVLDASGAAISNAQLKATETQTGAVIQAFTDKAGGFHFNLLPPGIYQIEILKDGFGGRTLQHVVVVTSQDTGVGTVTLGVAGSQTVIEVSDASTPLLETTQAQITNTFSAQNLEKFTNVNENQGLDNLALLVPGVNASRDLGYSNSNGAEFTSNGNRGRNNDEQVDGQNNNDNSVAGPALSVSDSEFASEYQIISNNFGPEYGRNGGSVANIVTKSGTNKLHGSIYGYWTDDNLEALSTYQKLEGVTSQPRSNTEFGGFTIGFPIVKDRLFFFNGFDQSIWHESEVYTSGTVSPTQTGLSQAAACSGVDANALAALKAEGPYSFSTGNPTTYGATSTTSVNGCDIEVGAVTRSVPELQHLFNWLPRVDYTHGKDVIVARYLFSRNNFFDIADNGPGGWFYNEPSLGQAVKLGWTRTLTDHIVNEFSVGFSRINVQFGGSSNNSDPGTGDITQGVTHVTVGTTNLGYGPGATIPQGRIVNTWQLQDNFNYQLGQHHLKAGINWTYQRSPNVFLPYINGSFSFKNWSNYLLSTPASVTVSNGNYNLDFREYDTFLYAGDDWQLTPNLTLNLGLTWSFYGQPSNLFNKQDTALQTGSDPLWDASLPLSVTTTPKIDSHSNLFAPSVGFAWTPKFLDASGRTVVRGGYRLAYDPPFYNIYLNMASSAPQVFLDTITTSSEIDGLLPASPTGPNVRSALSSYLTKGVSDPRTFAESTLSKNFNADYVQSWSLGVQHQISNNVAVEIRYVGNHGGNLFQSINANPYLEGLEANYPQYVPSGTSISSVNGREHGDSYLIRERTNTGWSDYHSLQTQLRADNLFRQLLLTAGYTWSKTTDNVSEIYSSGGAGATTAFSQNPLNYKQGEHSLSGLDFPQNFTLNFVEEIPLFKQQHGLKGRLLGGWDVSGTYFLASGQTYTATQYEFDYYSGHTGNTDYTFNSSFAGTLDGLRPFLGNRNISPKIVGAYAGDVCNYFGGASCNVSPTTLISWNSANASNDASVVTTSANKVRYIMNSQYAQQAFGAPFGNTPRNDARDAWTNSGNLSVTKNIKLNEHVKALLRANFTNVFNHPNYGSVDPYLDDAGYHTVDTGFGDPTVTSSTSRQITFSAKIFW